MFAAITQYKLKLSKNDGPPLTYGLPLLVAGTLGLGAGMFLCAFIVETSTEECVWIPQPAISPTAAAVIWLQQGGQTVGDQRLSVSLGAPPTTKSSRPKNEDCSTYFGPY